MGSNRHYDVILIGAGSVCTPAAFFFIRAGLPDGAAFRFHSVNLTRSNISVIAQKYTAAIGLPYR